MGLRERNWKPRILFSSWASKSSCRSGWLSPSAARHLCSRSNSWSSSGVNLMKRCLAAPLQQIELVVQLGVLDFLAVLLQALEPLLHHHEVAENQLRFHVFQVAYGVHRAFFVGNGFVLKQAQNLGESVHHPQTGQVAGIAQVLLRDGRHIHVFHRGMRDFERFEEARQFLQARVRHFRDAHARGRGTDAGFLVDSGQNGEQRGLAYHGQADNGGLHIRAAYRGTSTWLRMSSMMRSPTSARRGTSAVRVLMTTRCAKMGTARRFTSSGMAKSRPASSASACVARYSACDPRGLTPSASASWLRVFSTMASM